jgi:hypothetical protein
MSPESSATDLPTAGCLPDVALGWLDAIWTSMFASAYRGFGVAEFSVACDYTQKKLTEMDVFYVFTNATYN